MGLLRYNCTIKKGVDFMPHIIPIKDLKNTSEVSELCHKSDEPIFVTKNGYGDMVIMSMEAYERNMYLNNIYKTLEISRDQFDNGTVHDGYEVLRDLKEEYGL